MLEKTATTALQPAFISIPEAAKILRIHPKTLYQYITDGVGPPVHRFGKTERKTLRLRYADFLKWTEGKAK